MKKILPYFLISAVFLGFLFVKHPGVFRYKFNSDLIHDYLRSQDIEDTEDKIKDRIFLSDSDIYIASGYLYAKGEDPAKYNLHPPAVKYLFGYSTLLTGNPFYVQIFFGLALILLTYFLGLKIFKNGLVAFVGTLLLLIDPVFSGMMSEALLDLGQAVFALTYVILMFFYPQSYILQGLSLGLFAASKFWSTAIVFVILIFTYKIFVKKEKINYTKTLLSFLFSLIVFSLTYLKSGELFNLFAYQGRVLKFMLDHNSAVQTGGPLFLFLTGFFAPWWGSGMIKSAVWSLFWPVGLISSALMTIRTRVRDAKFFFYVLPVIYLLLSSTQVPFPRYFILILPYVYLNLASVLESLNLIGEK